MSFVLESKWWNASFYLVLLFCLNAKHFSILQLCCAWEKNAFKKCTAMDEEKLRLRRENKKRIRKHLITGCDYGKNVPDDRIFVTELFVCVCVRWLQAKKWMKNIRFRGNPIVKRHSDWASAKENWANGENWYNILFLYQQRRSLYLFVLISFDTLLLCVCILCTESERSWTVCHKR